MKTIAGGVVHRVPNDLRTLLQKQAEILRIWNDLTPLARNEWICYLTLVRKVATRKEHLHRLEEDLRKGKKRPCCWPGCPHRRPSAAKWLGRRFV